jgi:hypothetical protein
MLQWVEARDLLGLWLVQAWISLTFLGSRGEKLSCARDILFSVNMLSPFYFLAFRAFTVYRFPSLVQSFP